MLEELERWLRGINESAADSLMEAFDELLALHHLKVPAIPRKSPHRTSRDGTRPGHCIDTTGT